MTASPARSALRGLIRAVNRNVTNVAGNRQWRDFIIASAREQPSDPQLGHDRLVLAKDLTLLINNVKHHQELLSRYNIGIDSDERNKKMVEAVAKRVGFKLPEEPKAPRQ